MRRDFLFVDKPVVHQEIFSGISNAYNGPICCLKVDNATPISLEDLISKYRWAPDDIEHLKSIKGWRYIYEAIVVDKAQQNNNMRELVSMTGHMGDLSPFSSGLISGDEGDVKMARGKLTINGAESYFSSSYDENLNVMKYNFDYKGRRLSFSEKSFPVE